MKPVVKLTGTDGHAFMILGACVKAAKKAGWEKLKIDAFKAEATDGDYGNLLRVCQKYFDVR